MEYIGEEGAAHVRIASSWLVQKPLKTDNVADPGYLDPNFFHPGSRIRIKKYKYFNPQNIVSTLLSVFVSTSAQFDTCTVVGLNGTIVEIVLWTHQSDIFDNT